MKTHTIPQKLRDAIGGAPRKPFGRHPDKRLTAVRVRTLTAPGRYADGHGLYLVVDDAGSKRWMWRGVIQGKRCDLGLGSAALVSLANARDQAIGLRRQARAGEDPRLERQRAKRPVPTFATAARAVHGEHGPTFRNAKHRAQWLSSLESYAFDLIGGRRVDTITAADVLAVLSPIWTAKPETARRVKQRIKLVMDWATAHQLFSGTNPTIGITKVLPKHKGDKAHHAALPYAKVPAFVRALRTLPDLRPSVRGALELLILTASRTNEVLLAEWDEIDLKRRVWTVPAARMKAGKAHEIPLSARAVELLTRQRALRLAGPLVFPGQKPRQPLSDMTLLKAARRLAKAITVHGFRSSFRDWSAEQTNIPRDVCEAALAHTLKDKTEAAYKRTTLLAKRRELMQRWSAYVTTRE
jgi:integrase